MELAEQRDKLGQTGSGNPAPPEVYEYSREVEVLAAIYSRLGELISATVRKRLRLKPWPTPVTAAEQLEAKKAREAAEHIESVIRFV